MQINCKRFRLAKYPLITSGVMAGCSGKNDYRLPNSQTSSKQTELRYYHFVKELFISIKFGTNVYISIYTYMHGIGIYQGSTRNTHLHLLLPSPRPLVRRGIRVCWWAINVKSSRTNLSVIIARVYNFNEKADLKSSDYPYQPTVTSI
ncbi:uncharacterized protein LOC111067838 [Drosophila obscura]|uniref:uncharacterized protein LOC111067838 n=1 Tax=Drosophila obscura TaxID=7282 RepID=UPI001BB1B291|nr:uncharacterized protein LOC111067838 [Drosophila obscura]